MQEKVATGRKLEAVIVLGRTRSSHSQFIMVNRMCMLPMIAFILTCTRLHLCEGSDVIWTRDTSFDGMVKTGLRFPNDFPGGSSRDFPSVPSRTEILRKTARASACAILCTRYAWCSSFFFVPETLGCVLHQRVLARPKGGQPSPGAMYFKATIAGCPCRDGYVWVRDQKTCFKFFNGTFTFRQAYSRCTAANTELTALSSRDKHQAVATYVMDAYDKNNPGYIGAVRTGVVDGSRTSWNSSLHPLTWLRGGVIPLSGPNAVWWPGNPSNNGGTEGCVEFGFGYWNDIACSLYKAFICELLI